ncbi:protein transport protein sec31 isoform X2 [Drosophila innubila]|uniref:protein transport protein sec31 isoform X2 n=1 Tax=Drosophila innubila TaxID=198719 RepID=UPI00148C3C65|nr:protein transport protein sec31 isoform X2 [Drosophila innubila]
MQTRNLKLKQRSCRAAGASVTVTLLLTLALLRIDVAVGRPDVRQSPFALDLQPPLLEPAATDATFKDNGDRAIDSYGNPIDALRPIDTPDGRKVVSAQGVQFEIPNYASGITEIRQPADDLLPPHIAPALHHQGSTTTTTAAPLVDPNPFNSATLPPWLQDFDYPDVGPGVPYNPDNFKEPSSGQPQAGAPFDTPTSISGQSPTSTEQFPLSADSPKVEYTKSDEGKVISTPVNTLRKDSQPSVAPPTRSSVSNTGKYTGGFGGPPGLLRPQNVAKPDIYVAGNDHEFSNTVKANRQRPGAAPAPAANTGRYTGGFGAPSGVLSPQNAPRPFQQAQPQPQPQPQSQSQPQPQATRSHPQLSGAASSHHQNRFGGPPGILVPFDNVQRTGEQ